MAVSVLVIAPQCYILLYIPYGQIQIWYINKYVTLTIKPKIFRSKLFFWFGVVKGAKITAMLSLVVEVSCRSFE